jgi:signal recognition particle GTPase
VFGFFKSGKPNPVPDAVDALAPPPSPVEPAPPVEAPRLSWAQRLKQGLSRTRGALTGQITSLFGVGAKIDEALFEELETVLLSADVGVEATQHLTDRLRARVKKQKLTEADQLKYSQFLHTPERLPHTLAHQFLLLERAAMWPVMFPMIDEYYNLWLQSLKGPRP